jgi:hypothetical protein
MITIELHIDGASSRRLQLFRRGLVNRYTLALFVFLIVGVPIMLRAAPTTVPHTFQPGTVISASQVNDNFNALLAGVNANDSRLTRALSSLNGIFAYAGTAVPDGPLARSYNSTAGAVTVSGSGGGYVVRFAGIDCGASPGKGLAIAQSAGTPGITCRVNGDWGNDANTCRVYVGCFSTSGSLEATPFSLMYVQ